METDICEKCRERILEEGEDIFIPLVERMTSVRGERTLVMSRLFPGYLFVETDRIEDFQMRLKEIPAMTELSEDKPEVLTGEVEDTVKEDTDILA